MLRKWNKGQMCNDSEDQTSKYICFSMLYMESQKGTVLLLSQNPKVTFKLEKS